jgi:hypothetical protein
MSALLSTSAQQLLGHLAAAVAAGDRDEFELQTACGVAYFDGATVAALLNEHLPLQVNVAHIPTLLQMMTGDGYAAAVDSFCAELMQVAASNGMEIGVDVVADRHNGTMRLTLSERAAAWVIKHYPPHALRQAAPWTVVGVAQRPLLTA